MDLRDRIQRYLDATPGAVSGNGGHNQTYFVACQLVNGFDLGEAAAYEWLCVYNQKCDPPWTERELMHKVGQALKATNHSKPRGHLIGGNGTFSRADLVSPKVKAALPPKVSQKKYDAVKEMNEYLNGFSCTDLDLQEASPIRLEDSEGDGWLLLETLFEPDEFINYVIDWEPYTKKGAKEIKANPIGLGVTDRCRSLVKEWGAMGTPFSDAGGWLRINPVDGNGVNDKNVTAFRFALVEFDAVPIDMQISFLARVPLPIAAILTSGGKSVHAWIKVEADDFKDYEATVEEMRNLLTRFGIDRTNKNPSRLSRLVGVTRKVGATGDGKQKLLYLNPKPEQRSIIQETGIMP